MSCNGGMVGSVVCLCLCFGHRILEWYMYVSLTSLNVGVNLIKRVREVRGRINNSHSMDLSGTEEVE